MMEINLPLTELLINGNSCFYIILNKDGDILFANDLFVTTIAKPQMVVENASITEFIDPADKGKIETTIIQVQKTESVKQLELIHPAISGNPIKIKWNLINKPAGDKTEIHCLGVEQVYVETSNLTNKNIAPEELVKILDHSLDVICTIDEEGKFASISKACTKVFGYQPEELLGKHYIDFVLEEDRSTTTETATSIMLGNEITNFENRYVRKDGSSVPILWTATWDADERKIFSVGRDGTHKKANEATIKSSEERYKLLFYNNPQPMWIYNTKTHKFLEVNEAAVETYGYSRGDFFSMTMKDLSPTEEVTETLSLLNSPESLTEKAYWKHLKKDGTIIHAQVVGKPIDFEGQQATLVSVNEITEQVLAEEKLIKSNERYHYASKAAFDAIWDWDLATNEIYWSDGYETLFGYKVENNKGNISSLYDHIHAKDKKRVIDSIDKSIKEAATNWEEEYRFTKSDGSVSYVINRGLIIKDEKDQPCRMIGAMQDHTVREKNEHSLKTLNASLAKRAAELASSNEELERFAYVASHDLQEPLRMVSSFLQLLQKRYKDKLDSKANEYIHFAVDGAERMKTLILDLLKFSRVNTSKEEHGLVDLNETCKSIMLTYKQRIAESEATINVHPLPTILGSKTELVQLFQNLIGNALKYHGENAPVIEVKAKDADVFWEFSIADNGIGIDPRFFKKIFVIFQRLHHKNEYSGTGIGLAICKKIIERHGGSIWVESATGEGSTFYFTLPKNLQEQAKQNPRTSRANKFTT
jgi:two-component system CheB/CheR fusion protein